MKLVLVEWFDAHSRNQWNRLSELREGGEALRCRSVGWLAHRNKTQTTLVSSLSGEKNGGLVVFGSGDITIPNCCITKVTVLRK